MSETRVSDLIIGYTGDVLQQLFDLNQSLNKSFINYRRHLFQIDIPMDPFEPMSVELPADEIEAIPPGAEVTRPIDKQRVIDYLVNGGLISILRSNLSGGKNQPRVWLCLDQLGNVTHTFILERGVISP